MESTVTGLYKAGLLDLPAEIRIRIYRHCFKHRQTISEVDWIRVDVHQSRLLVRPTVWPLFLVCKRISGEVVPEYYSYEEFHFNSVVHLQKAISEHRAFKTYVRNVVLNPHLSMPKAEELLELKNLQKMVMSNGICHEPMGTTQGKALDHETLKLALIQLMDKSPESHRLSNNLMDKVLNLRDEMDKFEELKKRGVHLFSRFTYSYKNKSEHPDGWGGKTDKRRQLIDYDCMNDSFTVLRPDPGQRRQITPPEVS